MKIILDEKQKEAIRSAFNNNITVITGPAGSGKSLICKYIVDISHEAGLGVRLMAPTGKAAQVLSEKTGLDAATIHRSLKMIPGSEMPGDTIREDIIIIDEVSMCGIDTFYPIMVALEDNPKARLVLVGDKNQLPSVSAGNFLSDIIQSKCANVVVLDKIHRQNENSFIPIIANEISKGKIVSIPNNAIDIKWHKINIDTFKEDMLEFIDEYLKEGKNIDDLQIISPMKKGNCGVFFINRTIQEKMSIINHTEGKYLQIGFSKFHLNDRVIQIENDYKKDVFNGEIGKIVELGEKVIDPNANDKKTRYITVQFLDGRKIIYRDKEIDALNLAFCLTVHKAQGSQSPYVIMIMANEQQIMMCREIVYTGITRASKQIDIFGHENMLRVAPMKSSIKKRYTNVQKIIDSKRLGKEILKVLEKQ